MPGETSKIRLLVRGACGGKEWLAGLPAHGVHRGGAVFVGPVVRSVASRGVNRGVACEDAFSDG
jgi:hypothetical protein